MDEQLTESSPEKMEEDGNTKEVFPGWEKTFFRRYAVISNDNKVFWCSPDALVNGSKMLKTMMIDGDVAIIAEEDEIPLDISAKYLSYILRKFHNRQEGAIKFHEFSDIVTLMDRLFYLDALPLMNYFIAFLLDKCLLVNIYDLDTIPDSLHHWNDEFVRKLYKKYLLGHIKEAKPFVVPEDISHRTMRYLIEELMKIKICH